MDEDKQYPSDLSDEENLGAYGMRIEGEDEDEDPELGEDEPEDEDLI